MRSAGAPTYGNGLIDPSPQRHATPSGRRRGQTSLEEGQRTPYRRVRPSTSAFAECGHHRSDHGGLCGSSNASPGRRYRHEQKRLGHRLGVHDRFLRTITTSSGPDGPSTVLAMRSGRLAFGRNTRGPYLRPDVLWQRVTLGARRRGRSLSGGVEFCDLQVVASLFERVLWTTQRRGIGGGGELVQPSIARISWPRAVGKNAR
jgi:hypothetical protein